MAVTTGHMRRAYFALVKELGMSEENRRDLNERETEKRSSKDFTRAEWKRVVAELQRINGQDVQPGRPRLKADKPEDLTPEDGLFATERQCALIEDLCDQIEWRAGREHGPLAYVLKHFLLDQKYTLIKRRLTASNGKDDEEARKPGEGDGNGKVNWKALPRDVASGLIVGLRNMAKHYPTTADEETRKVGSQETEGRG